MQKEIPKVKNIFILVELDDGTIHQAFPDKWQMQAIQAVLSTKTLDVYERELSTIEIERREKKEKQ